MTESERSKLDPLSGAIVFILNREKNSKEQIGTFVSALGGSITDALENATHALLAMGALRKRGEAFVVSSELEALLLMAHSFDVPVVDADAWLDRIARLMPYEHWSDVDATAFLPSLAREVLKGAQTEAPAIAEVLRPQTRSAPRTRRDHVRQMSVSMLQTFDYLAIQNPDMVEDDAIRRAVELSLLECALVTRQTSNFSQGASATMRTTGKPHEILGVEETASTGQIRKAYLKLARKKHPDKGGTEAEFAPIAVAYRILMAERSGNSISVEASSSDLDDRSSNVLKSTAHWDKELKDHRRLVEELFASHGSNIAVSLAKQEQALEKDLQLKVVDVGSTNTNEKEELIHNSCFYLSLAASYLDGVGALAPSNDDDGYGEEDTFLIQETALQLKRAIEGAVVRAKPEWAAQGKVGEEVQAFSDFLVYSLDSPEILVSDWAVVVFDTTSGFCDVYKGKFYNEKSESQASWMEANTLTIRYLPGHYQALLPIDEGSRPTLAKILQILDENGIVYVVTDGES